MNKKMRYILSGGIILAVITYLAEIVFLRTCDDGLGCLAIGTIYQIPGLLLGGLFNISNSATIKLFSIIFYFILGGIIGLIVYAIRNKNKK